MAERNTAEQEHETGGRIFGRGDRESVLQHDRMRQKNAQRDSRQSDRRGAGNRLAAVL